LSTEPQATLQGRSCFRYLHREHSPELMGCANRMSGSSSFNLTNALAADVH
jgi:hypothetical protein